jgi:hypothetical protein
MASPRVYADFQNLDDENRLRLTCAGTRRDLERQGIELREGMSLTLYADDADDEGKLDELLAEAVVQYNDAEKCWAAAIDWNAIRHASDAPKTRSTALDFGRQRNSRRFMFWLIRVQKMNRHLLDCVARIGESYYG